ncbi:hypothetical protein CCHL11_06553 [Colletotrichum chlorophyti]|uniref:RING-type domain-containing protein n=1 Tax=Colletotrichum chlorophyti TaxID=708187 RepID=A0A1Q8RS00_9PEZI|nr:hypothetical protein CCHL11_06553 [Colletotrichum chlorophyti]
MSTTAVDQPAHQCRDCRASFCQPLTCGHVYCDKCFRKHESCPECRHLTSSPTSPTSPPTVSPDYGKEYTRDNKRDDNLILHERIHRINWMVTTQFVLLMLELGVSFVLAVIVIANKSAA